MPGRNWPGRPAAYTETMTARPIAPPSCWKVCSRPEAEPACSGATPVRTSRGGGHEHQAGREAVEQHRAEGAAEVAVPAETWLSQAKLVASPIVPTTNIGVRPSRASSRGVTRDIAKMPSVSGRKARPVVSGPKPSWPSRYCTARKNIDICAAHDQGDDGQAAEAAAAAQQDGLDHRVRDAGLGDRQHDQEQRAERRGRRRCGPRPSPARGRRSAPTRSRRRRGSR